MKGGPRLPAPAGHMHAYTNEYLASVKTAWIQYLEKGIALPDHLPVIRSEILESWKRSQQYGIKVDNPLNLDLKEKDFEKVLSANSRLIRIAYPYLLDLYNFVKGTNFLIHLCDKDGCILKWLADDELIQRLSQKVSNLREGSIRTEKLSGTDSTSLCLALKQPIQVMGEEHYLAKNHAFFCSSAPIFDDNDEFTAVLTVMGPRELYQHHTLGMVCAAVGSIEREMRMQKAYFDLTLTYSTLSSTIENLDAGVIILNTNKTIVQCNKKALHILKIPSLDQVANKPFFSVIKRDSLPESIRSLHTDIKNIGFTALTTGNQQVHLSLTLSIVKNQAGDAETIVLIIDEQKQVHQLINTLSGTSAVYTLDSIIGGSAAIQKIKEMTKNAAKSTSNVLILGESGTGKELLAQSIHNASQCANGPFIAVNCGSIPKALIESELFGYEAGAFTGASKGGRPGKFELADGGTIFLDEIGDMPLELQSALLRVLQMHEITRIGGRYAKKIDVRVIAATNIDLKEAVRLKHFRNDLYYRLNVLNILLPPLRDRLEDIPPLAEHFIVIYSAYMHKNIKGISAEAMNILKSYSWPGNIRELENIIERAINLTQADLISINELPVELTTAPMYEENHAAVEQEKNSRQADHKLKNHLLHLLEQENGNVQKVAQILNIPASTLYRKFKKYHIHSKDYRL